MENTGGFLGVLFLTQQVPDFLPGSHRAWGCLVSYYSQCKRGGCDA